MSARIGQALRPTLERREVADEEAQAPQLARCDGCDVSFNPDLTDARCPVCDEPVPGMSGVRLSERHRAFGLRFAWVFAVVAFLLLAHLLFPG